MQKKKVFMRLVVTILCLFTTIFSTACTPIRLSTIVDNLIENGYDEISLEEDEDLVEYIEADGDVMCLWAWKEGLSSDRDVVVLVFEKRSDLKSAMKEIDDIVEEYVGEDGVYKKSGKMIIIASSKKALEDVE